MMLVVPSAPKLPAIMSVLTEAFNPPGKLSETLKRLHEIDALKADINSYMEINKELLEDNADAFNEIDALRLKIKEQEIQATRLTHD